MPQLKPLKWLLLMLVLNIFWKFMMTKMSQSTKTKTLDTTTKKIDNKTSPTKW